MLSNGAFRRWGTIQVDSRRAAYRRHDLDDHQRDVVFLRARVPEAGQGFRNRGADFVGASIRVVPHDLAQGFLAEHVTGWAEITSFHQKFLH